MSTVNYSPAQVDFLSRFFGPGNLLRWDAYLSGAMVEASRELLAPLIEDFRNGSVPVLLPRVSDVPPATVSWYAMAHDARESRQLREQLNAFIGPTYTDFTGQYASLSSADSVERAVADAFSPHVFRLRVVKNGDRERVRSQLLLMRSLRERHPHDAAQALRPVGRLLRDLEMALVVRNESSARQCIDDLRARGRLSALNLAFLKIRLFAAFERWHELLALPETNSLLTIRRPSQVSHALVRAVYNVRFAKYEQAGDARGCVDRFRELEPSFGTLFRARGESHDPTVLKAFLVRAIAAKPMHLDTVQAIRDVYPVCDTGRPWVDALVSFASSLGNSATPSPQPEAAPQRLDAARVACEAEDYDKAFDLLAGCDPSPVVVRQLLACSLEIDSLDSTRRSLQYIKQCPDDVRDAALSMRAYRQMWEDLHHRVAPEESQLTSEAIPTGWIPWIERLNRDGPWDSAGEMARHGAEEWNVEEIRNAPLQVSELARLLLAARTAAGDTVLRNVLPEMLVHFLPSGAAVREFKPVYLSLAYVLALDDSINADDLVALATLAEAVLECAPIVSPQSGTNEFQELLDTLEAGWNHVAAPRHIDWALHILDLLIGFNVNAHAPIDSFLQQVINGSRAWARRIRSDQWDFLEQLASDIGQRNVLTGLRPQEEHASADTPSIFTQLAGKSVAIYTLTERIGARAAAVIRDHFVGVKVHVLHDYAATDRLEQLARNADIFIVNTWDAKHAATISINARRANDQTTLFPSSRSAGSIVRALYDYLDTSTVQRTTR